MRLHRSADRDVRESLSTPRRLLAVALQRPYITVFVVALLARTAVAIVVFVVYGGSLFLDDRTYSDMAIAAANGADEAWDPYTAWLYRRTGTFLVPLTVLYRLFGPVVLAGQLLVALFGAGTAVLTTRLAREVLDARGALFAGLAVALLPSQVLWSSLLFKDAAVWLLLAALAVVAAAAGRATGARLLALAGAAAAFLVLIGFLRLHTQFIAGIALLLASFAGARSERAWRVAGTAMIVIAVPWAMGTGPAGTNLLGYAGDLEALRLGMAAGGSSTIAGIDAAPDAEDTTAAAGSGETSEPSGAAEPAVDEVVDHPKPPPPLSDSDTTLRDLRHLPYGISAMLFEPVPWRPGSTAMRIASLEVVVWYPLLAFALLGAWRARRRLRVSAFPILVGGAALIMYSLTEGNIGTAFRHRGEFVWVVCFLAAVGVGSVRGWRRTPHADADAGT